MKKRKIVAITGSRAEYGLSKSIFKAIEDNPKLELYLIVTGTHLSPEFGYTIKEIEKDGFKIVAKIKNLGAEDTVGAMAMYVGKCVLEFVEVLKETKPDVLLVLTDLSHTLAGAIAGIYMNIPVAHLHGGDVSGNVDEPVRHAITKLSHIHFPATKKSAERIIRMGEDSWRVFTVGAPSLDTILHTKLLPKKVVIQKFNLDSKRPVILVNQHPVTTDSESAGAQMKKTMEVIRELGHQTIVTYPNADAGGREMISVIDQYKKYPFIQIYKNLPYIEYLSLMSVANVMIGNSSSGIIEAPSFHLPVVNIGERQEKRERASNVISVEHNREEIKKTIKKALYDKKFIARVKKCKSPYGNGKAGKMVASVLSKIKIDKHLLEKRLSY